MVSDRYAYIKYIRSISKSCVPREIELRSKYIHLIEYIPVRLKWDSELYIIFQNIFAPWWICAWRSRRSCILRLRSRWISICISCHNRITPFETSQCSFSQSIASDFVRSCRRCTISAERQTSATISVRSLFFSFLRHANSSSASLAKVVGLSPVMLFST